MPFNKIERDILLSVKGVGPTVVGRLEEIGIHSLQALSVRTADDICSEVAAVLGATCWKNSPQSRGAIGAAITAAALHSGQAGNI